MENSNVWPDFDKLIINAINIYTILPMDLTHFLGFYDYVPFKMLVFVVFCKELRIWVGEKSIPTKQLSIFFTMSFIRIANWKHQKQPFRSIPLKCFSRKLANP